MFRYFNFPDDSATMVVDFRYEADEEKIKITVYKKNAAQTEIFFTKPREFTDDGWKIKFKDAPYASLFYYGDGTAPCLMRQNDTMDIIMLEQTHPFTKENIANVLALKPEHIKTITLDEDEMKISFVNAIIGREMLKKMYALGVQQKDISYNYKFNARRDSIPDETTLILHAQAKNHLEILIHTYEETNQRARFIARVDERIAELRAQQKSLWSRIFYCEEALKGKKIAALLALKDKVEHPYEVKSLSQLIDEARKNPEYACLDQGFFKHRTKDLLNEFVSQSLRR